MKIYLLKVDELLQPNSQPIIYPAYNDDYGVEQDFLKYLEKNRNLVVDDPVLADWHYLPSYWTRWHLNHEYASKGLSELKELVGKSILKASKTFTVCQYDDGAVIELKGVTQMLSSRKGIVGIDIPLLAKPLKVPWIKPKKTVLASFMGRLSTHPIREEMTECLAEIPDVEIVDGNYDVTTYISTMLRSKIALCPRGYGGSSFRFYEAMQLGIVPLLIGDKDTRPFKNLINWDNCSFYVNNVKDVKTLIMNIPDERLVQMGKTAKKIWKNELKYQKWCKNAILELGK